MKSRDPNQNRDLFQEVLLLVSNLSLDHIEILDVKDINNYREFKSNRITNPLEPTYVVQNEDG